MTTTTPTQIVDSIGEFLGLVNKCEFVTPEMMEESFCDLESSMFEIPFPEWVAQ